MKSSLRLVILSLLLLVFVVLPAAAQSVTSDEVNAVAKGLYCPVCESEPLDTCQTQACSDWRDEIQVQLENGATQEEIHNSFRARYGDRVLAQPPADGFTLVLWLGIPIAVVLGGLGFGRYLRTIRQSKQAPTINKTESNNQDVDEYVRRIEEEIAKKS